MAMTEIAVPGAETLAPGGGPSFRRILVPIRLAADAAETLAVAARVCRSTNGVLRLLHVRIYDPPLRGTGRFYPQTRSEAAAVPDEALPMVWAYGLQATTAVVNAPRGGVASAIAWQASEWRADVIVMTRRPSPAICRLYPSEQVPQALSHFFRAGNLTALRELALRFLADETEGELLRYLARYRTLAPWPTTEHVMAGVTPVPGADAIIRRAARIAEASHADLDIVYIASGTDGHGRADHLARLRQVTSDAGASWHHLHAEDPATALVQFARDEKVTQIVLGASDRNRWQELGSGGSIVKRISRLAARAGIDVHIVAPHVMTAS